jgi:fumarate reductase subunit D
MTDLEKALADITAIRSQMARGAEFRGYGPMTVAATGLLAILGGVTQALWLPDPANQVLGYLALWLATATISVILIGVEMVARTRRIHSGIADEMIHTATEQFIPAGVAGALLTVVFFRYAPQSLWMLPGLWQIIFSLGFLASCRSLPRPMFAVGVWYLVTGLASLAFANEAHAFSPWAMAFPFGLGQLMTAAILYLNVAENSVGEHDAGP